MATPDSSNWPHVDCPISDAALPEYDKHKHLLGGIEVARRRGPQHDANIVTLAMPNAPEGAVRMLPCLARHDDGTVTLAGIDYYDVHGSRIT